MNQFLLGAIAMGSFVVGLMFLRFWRETRDTLFLLFAVSFWVEVANRTAYAWAASPSEGRIGFFVLRLVSYLLIVAGIVSKNLPRPPRA